MQKGFSLKKLYFTLISIAGIIGMLVGYGTLIYTLVNAAIISNEEYLVAGNYSYQIKECDNQSMKPDGKAYTKTPEELQKCKDEAKVSILQSRAYEKKTSIVNGIVRGTLFLILFITHFPVMMRKDQEVA